MNRVEAIESIQRFAQNTFAHLNCTVTVLKVSSNENEVRVRPRAFDYTAVFQFSDEQLSADIAPILVQVVGLRDQMIENAFRCGLPFRLGYPRDICSQEAAS